MILERVAIGSAAAMAVLCLAMAAWSMWARQALYKAIVPDDSLRLTPKRRYDPSMRNYIRMP